MLAFVFGVVILFGVFWSANLLSNRLSDDRVIRLKWEQIEFAANFKKLDYKKLINASVMISGTDNPLACDNPNPAVLCNGSGVIVKYDKTSNKTYILTNKHVIAQEMFLGCGVTVFLHDKSKSWSGKIFEVSNDTDLAIIEVEDFISEPVKVSKNVPELFDPLVNFSSSTCHSDVVALGYLVPPSYDTVLDTRAQTIHLSVDGGSSGSAVYNEDGELVGLVFAMYNIRIPIGYMIPIDDVKTFLKKAL